MTHLIAFLIASASIQPRGDAGGGACKFSLSPGQAQTKVVGPPEIVDKVVLLTQNDSPVQIIWADFTDAVLDSADGRFQFSDGHKFKVRNRSDRSINRVEVMAHVVGRTGGIGAGVTWNGELSPGQTTVLTVARGHGDGGAPDDEVKVLLGIESVGFADCDYWPSKSIPLWK